MKDLYTILGVAPDCEPDAIKAAYRALVLQHHPDQFQTLPTADQQQAHERFLEIKEAYEVLSDAEQREEYDIDFVVAFPEYELEGDEDEADEYWEENPPARMPVEHGDTSNGMLRLLLLLVLPVVTTTLMAIVSNSVWLILSATLGGLLLAIWLGAALRDGE